jgi:hypothetical protein
MPSHYDPFEQFRPNLTGDSFGDFTTDTSFAPQNSSGNQNFDSSIFDIFQEQNTQIPFQGALERFDPTPNQRSFFQNDRSNILDQFQAKFSQQLEAGQLPTAQFRPFINEFDFGQEFSRFGGQSNFAPRQRIIR